MPEGARGFKAAPRVVEPDVAALYLVVGEVNVAVLQKEDATVEGLFAGEVNDLAD